MPHRPPPPPPPRRPPPPPRHWSKFYRAYMRSDAWQVRRKAAIQRAGNRCECCGTPGSRLVPLQVHHRTYDRLGRERPDDLVVLCVPCHQRADAERKASRPRHPR